MYSAGLILGLFFSVYIAVLVFIAVKKRRAVELQTTFSGTTSSQPPRIREQAELIPNVEVADSNGRTIITWTPPANVDFVSTKIYFRVTNNPDTAVSRYEVPKSNSVTESYTHNRKGRRMWYWIALVYEDGTESQKQFVDVVPNDD